MHRGRRADRGRNSARVEDGRSAVVTGPLALRWGRSRIVASFCSHGIRQRLRPYVVATAPARDVGQQSQAGSPGLSNVPLGTFRLIPLGCAGFSQALWRTDAHYSNQSVPRSGVCRFCRKAAAGRLGLRLRTHAGSIEEQKRGTTSRGAPPAAESGGRPVGRFAVPAAAAARDLRLDTDAPPRETRFEGAGGLDSRSGPS